MESSSRQSSRTPCRHRQQITHRPRTQHQWEEQVDKNKADAAELALAYYGGVIREVYRIAAGLPAGSTQYSDDIDRADPQRMEFVGTIAESRVRNLYPLKDARHLFTKGDVNPVRYFWV